MISSDYQIQDKNDKHHLSNSDIKSELVNSVDQIVDSKKIRNAEPIHKFTLSWSHYLILMRIKNDAERSFYEIECAKQNWSVRQLQRQYNSSLYERLALSRDKDEMMRLAKEWQTVEKPSDVIKNPITLEFLGLSQRLLIQKASWRMPSSTSCKTFFLNLARAFSLRHGRNDSHSMRIISTLTLSAITVCCSAIA